MKDYLPINKEDMKKRGWEYLDFVYIVGDAYVDHPSFGHAIISRMLESRGYKVGIISQPNWRNISDFKKLGKPRLAFLVSSGNIDSMVNHYTVAKKKRQKDAYSPGGISGMRPDRAAIVYSNKAKEAYKDVPVIIGGIEASLRRFAHYDYWDNKIRRSILLDSKADLLIYGMGEKQIVEIADALDSGLAIKDISYVKGTVFKTNDISKAYKPELLPSFDKLNESKKEYIKSFMIQYKNNDSINGKTLAEPYGNYYIVQNSPADTLTQDEMDEVYRLPYMRNYHPTYESKGGVPAISEVKFSLTSSRGCFGNCSFCAITYHQGRVIQARSHKSIIEEAKHIINDPDFKGYIHDVGGPTANFRNRACIQQEKYGVCKNKECLSPVPCKNLIVNHTDYLNLLRKLRDIPKVKKVFVRSGIRYDYLIYDTNDKFFKELCQYHISGNLKVAPEHISENVLNKMGKPKKEIFEKFVKKFNLINKNLNKKQYIIPYFMSSHPGATLKDAIKLAEYLRDMRFIPEQVQDFYPTPGTLSTCMYYTEIDPRSMKRIYVAKNPHEKATQRALMHYNNPKNYRLVYEALTKSGRRDLIGYDRKCLIRPLKDSSGKKNTKRFNNKQKKRK